MLKKLLNSLILFFTSFAKPMPIPQPPIEPVIPPVTPRERLYEVAKGFLGKDASPNDLAPDEYGCADSLNKIYEHAFGVPICTPGTLTTQLFHTMFNEDERFKQVAIPDYGDIIISPTGYGNGKLPNGHCGVVAKWGIMSNDSLTGSWKENYDLASWDRRYRIVGGYPIYFFRVI